MLPEYNSTAMRIPPSTSLVSMGESVLFFVISSLAYRKKQIIYGQIKDWVSVSAVPAQSPPFPCMALQLD